MVKRKLSIVLVVLYTLLYTAAHIGAAVVLFSSVKFWLFLVMLLVPFIGDIAAIVCLFSIHCYWPFILYGVSMMLYIAGQMMAKQIDEKQKQRFCKYCGGAIDYITKKCKECNKQYFHVSTKFLKKTGIVIVFALMLGFNIYQYVLYKETNQVVLNNTNEIISLKAEIEKQNAKILTQNGKLFQLENRLDVVFDLYLR